MGREGYESVRCPLCGTPVDRTQQEWCPLCAVPLRSATFDDLLAADEALRQCQRSYDALASTWTQWGERREALADQLAAQRPPPAPRPPVASPAPTSAFTAPTAAPEPTAASAEPTPAAAREYAPGFVHRETDPTVPTGPAPASSALATPPSHQPPTQQPQAAPHRRTSRAAAVLTAPVLLGIAGASLMIAAAIVFVAIAWTTFTPLARGLAVLGVSVAVAALAVWLRRMHLPITSGAVGIVSMGFAGAAGISFLRGTAASGAFDLPLSLLLASGAGVVLSRWQLRWVGSAAALALVAAGVGLTIAASSQAADAGAGSIVSSMWAWALTGTAVAVALALTHQWWPWRVARSIIRWSAIGWACALGASVPLWTWASDATTADAVAGLVPLVALVALARWWPRAAVVATAVVASLLAPALAFTWGAAPWQQVAVLSVVCAVAVIAGLRLGTVARVALFVGLVPGYAVVALATVGYALTVVLARIVQGDAFPAIDLWAGAAALVAGLSLAMLRLWRLETSGVLARSVRAVSIVGAVLVATGAGVIAVGVAELTPDRSIHAAVSVALSIAGAALIAARRLWEVPAARAISSWAGIALLVVAAGHGVWGLQMVELPVALSLAAALVPVAVLAAHGRRHPWQGTGLATLFVTAVIAALGVALGASVTGALAVAVTAAAGAAWLVRRLPAPQQRPVLAGLVPAVAWGAISGVWSGLATLEWVDSPSATPDGWVAASALAAALALAAVRAGPERTNAAWAEPFGTALTVAAAPGALAALADQTRLDEPWSTVGVVVASGVGVAAALPLWRDRLARRLTRVSAVALVTLGGIAALGRLADDSEPLVPGLVLSLGAVALLAVAARWWPRAAVAPAVALATAVGPTFALREDQGITAAAALLAWGAALVLTAFTRAPDRWRLPAVVGASPALVTSLVGTAVVGSVAAASSLAGGRADLNLSAPWWALALTAGLIVGADRARRCLRGSVETRVAAVVGAVATVAAVVVATSVVVDALELGEGTRLALTPVVATVLGAAAVAWSLREGDALVAATARRGSIAWAVLSTFALEIQIGVERAPWVSGLLVVIGVAAALSVGWRRWPLEVIPPAVALVTLAPFAAGTALGASDVASACVAGVLVAATAWAGRRLQATVRTALWVGASPAGVAVGIAALAAVVLSGAAVVEHLTGETFDAALSWWHVGAFATACVTALAWRELAWFRGWMPLALVVVGTAALPPLWAATVLGAAGPALLWWGRRLGAGAAVAVTASGIGLLWAVGSDVALAGTAAGATVVAVAIARGWRTAARTWGAAVSPFTAAVAGASGARALGMETIDAPVAMGLAMAVLLLLVDGQASRLRDTVTVTAAAITVAIPLVADSVEMAGVALLLAAVGWWRLRSVGVGWATWMCAAAASLGTALILLGADVQVIEAYTAVPAASLLLIGAQWLRERPQLRSLTALAPGLAIALIPSYAALALQPDALARTVGLVAATIVMALVGVRLRWFAPILGTAVTAVVVSVLQIVVGANLLVRLVAFAVVGTLLLAISSWFEKIKELR